VRWLGPFELETPEATPQDLLEAADALEILPTQPHAPMEQLSTVYTPYRLTN
jgi:hypothetical protein